MPDDVRLSRHEPHFNAQEHDMLVVSMKEAGILRVGEATIYIREIRGSQVRISVTAPQDIKIKHLEPAAGEEPPASEVVRRSRMGRR